MSTLSRTLSQHWKIHAAGLAACVAIVAGVVVAGVRPAVEQYAGGHAQQAKLADQQAMQADLERQVEASRERLAQLQQQAEDTPLQLAPLARLNPRLAALTDLCAQAGLQISQLQQAGHRRVGERAVEVTLHIHGQSSYRSFVQFLRELHQSCPDTGVVSFTLTGRPGRPNHPGAFTIQLVWHAQPL